MTGPTRGRAGGSFGAGVGQPTALKETVALCPETIGIHQMDGLRDGQLAHDASRNCHPHGRRTTLPARQRLAFSLLGFWP